MNRRTDGVEIETAEARHRDRDEPTIISGELFVGSFGTRGYEIEAVAAKMAGARVTIADNITATDLLGKLYTE